MTTATQNRIPPEMVEVLERDLAEVGYGVVVGAVRPERIAPSLVRMLVLEPAYWPALASMQEDVEVHPAHQGFREEMPDARLDELVRFFEEHTGVQDFDEVVVDAREWRLLLTEVRALRASDPKIMLVRSGRLSEGTMARVRGFVDDLLRDMGGEKEQK